MKIHPNAGMVTGYSGKIAKAHSGKLHDLVQAQRLDARVEAIGDVALDDWRTRMPRVRRYRRWYDPEMGCWRTDVPGPAERREIEARQNQRALEKGIQALKRKWR